VTATDTTTSPRDDLITSTVLAVILRVAGPVVVDHRLVWQVCEGTAWRAIGDALFDAQRYL
jgi:hypothetical protein